jgi:isoleucyl-tRNA synthetase
MPFVAERVWQAVTGYGFKAPERSVHLEAWPEAGAVDQNVLEEMSATRRIAELALARRDAAGIKVRQPLAKLTVHSPRTVAVKKQSIDLIKDELNVKEVEFAGSAKEIAVDLDTVITPELRQEGLKRELVRQVNAMRKEARLTIRDQIALYWQSDDPAVHELMAAETEWIKRDVLADVIEEKGTDEMRAVKLNDLSIQIAVKKLGN